MRRAVFLISALAVLGTPATPCRAADAAAGVEFFENRVRPVLAAHCFQCHGPEKQNNGLRLDQRAGWTKGSDYGPVVDNADIAASRLLKAIRHAPGVEPMPREGTKLPDAAAADIEAWLRMGMPWPEEGSAAPPPEAWRTHWAFQKVRPPEIPAPEALPEPLAAWRDHPLDRLVAARLTAEGLSPSPPASRQVLLKRASILLLGLPPSWAEVQSFVNDPAPDAWERRVDGMLASPHFGERWARHWMDTARYADTKGYVFQEERRYAYAYTYRDWLIRAFNADMPYDRFLTLQIAADRVVPEGQPADLAAMGFLTLGRRFLNNQNDIIDDRLDVVFRGTQALTVGCARCHDHKFDPIPTADYYALHGVFANSHEPDDKPQIGEAERTPELEAFEKGLAEREAKIEAFREQRRHEALSRDKAGVWFKAVAEAGDRDDGALREFARSRDLNPVVLVRWRQWVRAGGKEGNDPEAAPQLRSLTPADLEPGYNRKHREALNGLRQEVEKFKATSPAAPPRAMVLRDKDKATEPVILIRGNPGRPGPQVTRRFLTCLSEGTPQPLTEGSGRLQLAHAIASRDNPLTARVHMNRVWARLFGAPLVDSPGDFGVRTAPPAHPALLEWAAWTFMEDGWSLKRFLRRVLLSRTWQQESRERPTEAARDPDNRFLWRQTRQRLDFEALRDSLLQAAGGIDPAMHGRAVDLTTEPFTQRRSVYGFIDRQNLPNVFRTFDFAGPDASAPRRYETTVPQQALYMMNSPFVQAQARRLSGALAQLTDPGERIRELNRRILQREPEPEELSRQLAAVEALHREPRQSGTRWQYGRGDWPERGSAFTPLPWFGKGRWSGSDALPDNATGWTLLNAEGGHPGADEASAAVRRWTAPERARVRIAGRVKVGAPQSNGVRAAIRHGRTGVLWQATVPGGGEAAADVPEVAVEPGDTLDFIVDSHGSENSDGFTWAPVITDLTSGVTVADARADFGGPGMGPWEAFTQVLLCTNEFLFAD